MINLNPYYRNVTSGEKSERKSNEKEELQRRKRSF